MSTADEVVIAARFQGPPDSANGGYACGILAGRLPPGDAASVTLHKPVPLERPLRIERGEAGALALIDPAVDIDGDARTLVTARPCDEVDVGEIPAVALEQARAVLPDEEILAKHPFPGCFGCGTNRTQAEAVALKLGNVGDGVWATIWHPAEALPHEPEGDLTSEVMWTALDCPSAFAAVPAGSPPHLLGRIEGTVARSVGVGEALIVLAWSLGEEGRKRWGATAILGPGGELRAHARATWIAVA